MSASTGTVRLHRVLKSSPEKLYKAFLDPDALIRWLPPFGFLAKMESCDPREGGGYRMSFINFGTGSSHSFAARFTKLVPGELIEYTDTFDDPHLPGEMQVTVTFREVLCGTELNIVQAGLPAAIPVEMCNLGWQESLVQLANLVEPDIPNHG